MPPPRATAAVLAAALAVTVGGCRGARARAEALRPSEVLIEVLPRSARVELDGRPLGAGGGAVASPIAADEHVLRVSAEGYEPEERVLPAGSLDGARIARGAPAARLRLGGRDRLRRRPGARGGRGVARRGAANRAMLPSTPSAPSPSIPAVAVAHRALGDARARAGEPAAAVAAWAGYLRRSPEAADAAAVERLMEGARRDGELRDGAVHEDGRQLAGPSAAEEGRGDEEGHGHGHEEHRHEAPKALRDLRRHRVGHAR